MTYAVSGLAEVPERTAASLLSAFVTNSSRRGARTLSAALVRPARNLA